MKQWHNIELKISRRAFVEIRGRKPIKWIAHKYLKVRAENPQLKMRVETRALTLHPASVVVDDGA
jgi:hypothetical protein